MDGWTDGWIFIYVGVEHFREKGRRRDGERRDRGKKKRWNSPEGKKRWGAKPEVVPEVKAARKERKAALDGAGWMRQRQYLGIVLKS